MLGATWREWVDQNEYSSLDEFNKKNQLTFRYLRLLFENVRFGFESNQHVCNMFHVNVKLKQSHHTHITMVDHNEQNSNFHFRHNRWTTKQITQMKSTLIRIRSQPRLEKINVGKITFRIIKLHENRRIFCHPSGIRVQTNSSPLTTSVNWNPCSGSWCVCLITFHLTTVVGLSRSLSATAILPLATDRKRRPPLANPVFWSDR